MMMGSKLKNIYTSQIMSSAADDISLEEGGGKEIGHLDHSPSQPLLLEVGLS